jgi:hypothetical protein
MPLTGAEDYNITISGSLVVTGSIKNPTITEDSVGYQTVMVNTASGEFFFTGSYGGGGGGAAGTSGTSGTDGTSGTSGAAWYIRYRWS